MYQQIREKINEQCPWLMELKFGCEIEGNNDHPTLKYVGENNDQHCLLVPKNQALLFVDTIEKKPSVVPLSLRSCCMR